MHRAVAGVLVTLLTVLTFELGYLAALEIEDTALELRDALQQIDDVDATTPVDDASLPDAAVGTSTTIVLSPPRATHARGAESVVFEARPLGLIRERAPPLPL